MNYLVDGHNLIPQIGLDLNSLDDELALLARLQVFATKKRAHIQVYFDGAPPGNSAIHKAGLVTAHFVRKTSSADAAIENQLIRLKAAARNWTVVSSDHRVQMAASAAHAKVLGSDAFARQVMDVLMKQEASGEQPSSKDSVEYWLGVFGEKRG